MQDDPMLIDTSLPESGAWNSWSERPAEMVFLPLGVRLTPLLYSAKARQATTITAPAGIRFGPRTLDGESLSFEADHAGTRLAFTYAKPDPFCLVGHWRDLARGEWGLRFWVTLCLSAEAGAVVRYDAAEGAAIVQIGQRVVALVSAAAPVQVTGHATLEAVAADFEAKGYFDTSSRAVEAPVIALRFNLEMMASNGFAAAVADDAALAIAGARAALAAPPAQSLAPVQTGRHAGALDAVRDVIGWNTLYDRINHRRTTVMSRIWNLGDFAVWFNDQTYAALMAGLFDPALSRDNMAAALASATPQGNFACLLTSRDSWVDRSQAPNGAFVAWSLYLRHRDRAQLAAAFPALARNQLWWRANRDPDGRGLVSCGTSDVGTGLYKGTAFGARNETGMDNSATHDEAVYDPVTRTLSTLDVGLNASLALDAEMLGHIARELGHAADAARFDALAASSREKIRTELWDEARGLFANRQRAGGFVASVGPTSLYPLFAGAASPEQAGRLLEHLADPRTFGGAYVIPNATRDDPAFADDVYWRGRIWPNVNFFIWHGLRRYGFDAEASAFAEKSMALFDQSWREERLCGENYSAVTGEITDSPDTDPFYSWGAMLPLLGVAEVMDVNPWSGWEIANTGAPVRLGPIMSPIGPVTVAVEAGLLTLLQGETPLFSTDLLGRLTHLTVETGLVSLRLHPAPRSGTLFRLAESLAPRLVMARLDGAPLSAKGDRGGLVLDLSGASAGARLDVHLSPAA